MGDTEVCFWVVERVGFDVLVFGLREGVFYVGIVEIDEAVFFVGV